MKVSYSLIFLLFLLGSCDLKSSNQADSSSHELVKIYYDNGSIKGEFRQDEDGARHGEAKTYFPSGKLKTEFTYSHGIKERSAQFYQNGQMEMEFFYVNGKKEGTRTKYWENGQVQSILNYKNNEASRELEEFNSKGVKISKYPKLIVKEIDNLMKTGEYIIEVYFDKIPGRGTYYQGKLNDGYFHDGLSEIKKVNGIGRIVYKPMPGSFLMKNLSFVGKYKTAYGNYYIDDAELNLALDF